MSFTVRKEIQALLVKCLNAECSDIVERQQLHGHVRIKCPYTLTPCKYRGIGCDTELKRKEISSHEDDDKLHLHVALSAVAALRAESLMYKRSGAITFAVRDFQMKKSANTDYMSLPFYTHANGYHMALEVMVNGHAATAGSHVVAFIHLLHGKYDSRLKWPFVGEVALTLLNQLENKHHHTESLSTEGRDLRPGSSLGIPLISHTELAQHPNYLMDDTLYIRMAVKVAGDKLWLKD